MPALSLLIGGSWGIENNYFEPGLTWISALMILAAILVLFLAVLGSVLLP